MESGIAAPEREALCHALTRLVSEHGWVGATPSRVAREAGVAPHGFYDHFRSLEQCYLAVFDRMLARMTRCARRAVASRTLALGADAWQEQLDAIFSCVLTFFSLEPALARTCLVEGLSAGPAARARRDDALGRFTSYVEGLRLTHGEPMPPLAAELIVLGTSELIHTRVARDEAEQLPTLLPELRQLWLVTVEQQVELPEPLVA
ncbi:MAG TPA: TetR/AcrR family transcriptional regulator [Thermoleophilaceae bacterium]|nr:TetR/AcrR family transcriptional regulator [Thermoleophilaceae bacterium]